MLVQQRRMVEGSSTAVQNVQQEGGDLQGRNFKVDLTAWRLSFTGSSQRGIS